MKKWRKYSLKFKSRPDNFGARKTEFAGVTYASKLEAKVAMELFFEQQAGRLVSVERQVPFELIPKPNRIVYVADFVVKLPDGSSKVIEAKGHETAVWKMKHKMFKHFYPDIPLEVRKHSVVR